MPLFTLCVRSAHKVSKLLVFILLLFITTFSDCFHVLMIYIKRSAILSFLSEIGGGGSDELSLWFIVLLLNGLFCVLQ